VLDDEAVENGSVLAIGRWDGEVVLATRWNGNDARPNGNPQSRCKATWFVVPNRWREYYLQDLSPDKVTMVRSLLAAG
jgi:hypothetical protein